MARAKDLVEVGFASRQADLLADGTYPVSAFGAVGDGTTDDAPAIQKAINAAVAAGHGTITFASGETYLIGETLIIPITANNITLSGYGASLTGAVNDSIIRISDNSTPNARAQYINILGLTITGSGYRDTTNFPLQNGIEINAIIACTLRDVNVFNIPNVGIIGTKSGASGSGYWEQVVFDHVGIRWCGYQTLSVGEINNNAAGDDLECISCLFNHGGEKVNYNQQNGSVYIKVINLQMSGCEVSGNYSIQNSGKGFRWGLHIQTAGGCLSAMHYEGNGNNQNGSADLFLDSAVRGLTINGSDHFGSLAQAPQYCIQNTGKGVVLNGVRWCGDAGIHVYDYVVNGYQGSFTQIMDIENYNNPTIQPNSATANLYGFGSSNLAVYDGYTRTGRRIEKFQTRYNSTNPPNIMLDSKWGNAASVTSVSAYDSHGDFTVNSSGTGQADWAGLTLSFIDGLWPSEPTAFFYQRTSKSSLSILSHVQVAINSSALTAYVSPAPTPGEYYVFSYMITGREV